MQFGPVEIIIVLLIVLFIFGAGRLPEVAKGVGRAINDFKKGVNGDSR